MTGEIYDHLSDVFGPGGSVVELFTRVRNYMAQMAKDFEMYLRKLGEMEIGGGTYPSSTPAPNPGGFAEGGTLIATKPTLAWFGEAGAERVDFTPLTRPGADVGKVFGGPLPSQQMQRIAIEMLLSPDLEARIVENSMGEFSDILVSVERAR